MERLSEDGSRDRGGVGGGGRSPVGAIRFGVVLWWLSRDRTKDRNLQVHCRRGIVDTWSIDVISP